MGNLEQDPQEWARELFEHELCAECGGDVEHHDIVAVNGNWFAQCKPMRTVRATVTVLVPVGHNVNLARAPEVFGSYVQHGSFMDGLYTAYDGADVIVGDIQIVAINSPSSDS
jgi:hypothetical protein